LPSVFEVNCHGGPAAVRAVCERLAAAGLREVDADRLMELEGLPRIRRDARRALRRAFTPFAARILLDQLNGALGGAIEGALANLALARGGSGDQPRTASCPDGLAAIDALLSRWRTCGRFLADPPRIVIAGRPNSGKSTLLNRLVGAERAITSAAPGTTRDYVEAEAALQGAPVVLVDTAGLREAGGEVERQGVERARRELARAAAVIYLIDAAEGATPEDEAVLTSLGARALAVLNKIDAAGAKKGAVPFFAPAEKGTVPFSQRREKGTAPFSALAISALTGEGVPGLVAAVLEKVGWRAPGPGAAVPFAADQAEALQAAREFLAAGRTNEAAQRLRSLLA
jgi:tRNA modification GTPase